MPPLTSFNDSRAGWVVALVAVALAAVGGMVTVSSRAGALEDRVSKLEANESAIAAKLDSISDAVARIEGRLENGGSSSKH